MNDWSTRCKILTTELYTGKIHILNKFPNAHSFADAIGSTAFIPFILSPLLYFVANNVDTNHPEKYLDGGFKFNFINYIPPNNAVHFSLVHPNTQLRPNTADGFTRAHYSIVDDINFVIDNMKIMSNPETSDAMFDKGYIFGCNNIDCIMDLLKLDDECC
jgi:hypothetical protein